MADFRIPLPDDAEEAAARELDWNRDPGVWTRSEREYGSSRWDMDLSASQADLDEILVFFRLETPRNANILERMGPGDCVLAHLTQSGTKDIVAGLCPDCGEHWLVYRLEADRWRLYGRTCGYSWFRGQEVDPAADPLLTSLLDGDLTR